MAGKIVAPESVQIAASCFVGIVTGSSVVIFNVGIEFIQDHLILFQDRFREVGHLDLYTLLVPMAGGAAVAAIRRAADGFEAKPIRTEPRRGNHAWRDTFRPFLKSAAAVATLGTGASLGPEGPSVEIGTNCAALLFHSLRISRRSKLPVIAAGSAAGFSAGFNAPIAGAFFAVEYVLQRSRDKGDYEGPGTSSTTIAMVLLSAVLAAAVSQVGLGSEPAFSLPTYQQAQWSELPLFMLLGLLSGAASVVSLQGIKWAGKMFEKLEDNGLPRWLHPSLGGLCTGVIALWFPQVLYAGFTNVNAILDASNESSRYTWYLLLQIAAAKVVATSICKTSGLVGGIYAPSLFLGAAVGCAYGALAVSSVGLGLQGIASIDSYAIVGMASVLAGVCRVPMTSVLLMFELTRDYNILLPSLSAVGLSYWVASFATATAESASSGIPSSDRPQSEDKEPRGIDSGKNELVEAALCRIDSEECSPERGLEQKIMKNSTCEMAMNRAPLIVDATWTLREVGELMLREGSEFAAVMEGRSGAFLGLCTIDQVERSLTSWIQEEGGSRPGPGGRMVLELVNTHPRAPDGTPLAALPETSLEQARSILLAYDIEHLAIVETKDGVESLVGVVRFADLRLACRREVVRTALATTSSPSFSDVLPSELRG